ncbi:MAG TPA: C1 family peptidase [Thermoanaerobaculia bacterium]|nr:C1 family peptidase [Thermoanaerobaculia bacterium]
MIDPKQKLTRFSQVYAAKERTTLAAAATRGAWVPAMRDVEMADVLARSDAVHESDGAFLGTLRSQYSISSVEELVAISRIDSKLHTTLIQDLGARPRLVKDIETSMLETPAAADEMSDWDRYEELDYALGCELDLSTPPPQDDMQLAGAALGAEPAGISLTVSGGSTAALPAVNLIDAFMPPIRDQGERGTCVAFTAMSALEYYLGRFGGAQGMDLSEQFAFWNMLTKKGGAQNLVAMYPLLVQDGSCRETTWPYYPRQIVGNVSQGPASALAAPEGLGYRCKQVVQLPPRSVPAIKQAIDQKRIVGIGIPVYNSWFNSAIVRKYGNITVPIPGEVPQQIGHAVALVGYEENTEYAGGGYFIVRNSWNGYWGAQSVFGPGYGTIPYRYIANHNWDAWCIVS